MIEQFRSQGFVKIHSDVVKRQSHELIIEIIDFFKCVASLSVPDEIYTSITSASDFLSRSIDDFFISDREIVSYVYDGVKNLPAFHRLYSSSIINKLAIDFLETKNVMLLKDSVGVRFDSNHDRSQLTGLHQEYHAFPYSSVGLVFWIPLTRACAQRGSVLVLPGSHKEGVLPYVGDAVTIERLIKEGQMQRAQSSGQLVVPPGVRKEEVILEGDVGDVVVMDALLLHGSHIPLNRHASTRITMQARCYSFSDGFARWRHDNVSFHDGLKDPLRAYALYEKFFRENNAV